MGLLIVLVRAGTPDLLPDPLGCLLILHGVRSLPPDLPHRTGVLVAGVVAAVVSVPLWVPVLADRVLAGDESLPWAVNLPQVVYVTLLETPAVVVAGAVLLTAIVLCLVHAARPWGGRPGSDDAAGPPLHDGGTALTDGQRVRPGSR
ncbi:MAG: hypothetical protein ACXWDL_07760 [Nocardioides sp.]